MVVIVRCTVSHHCKFVSVGIKIEVVFFEMDINAGETDFFIVVRCKICLVRILFLPAVFNHVTGFATKMTLARVFSKRYRRRFAGHASETTEVTTHPVLR
jgi:hypothetical protein